MPYLTDGHRAAHNVEAGIWAGAGLAAINVGNAVRAVRDRIDAQRLADHAELARDRGEAVRLRCENAIDLLARERRNAHSLANQLVAAKLEAARVIELEDQVAALRKALRIARHG